MNDEQRAQFREKGWFVVQDAVRKEHLDALNAIYDEELAKSWDGRSLAHGWENGGMVRPEDVVARETELLPSYQPLGEMFCDLHDRPERMLAKGVISDIVSWKGCRSYFYHRIKRKIEMLRLVDGLLEAGKADSWQAAAAKVEAKVPASTADKAAYEALAKLSPVAL